MKKYQAKERKVIENDAIINERVIQVFEPTMPYTALYHGDDEDVIEFPVLLIAVAEIQKQKESSQVTYTELWPITSMYVNMEIMNPRKHHPATYYGFHLDGDTDERTNIIVLGRRNYESYMKTWKEKRAKENTE